MVVIPITVGRSYHEGKPKTTTTADFPAEFLSLGDALKATIVGQCSEHLSRLVSADGVAALVSLPNPTRVELHIEVTEGENTSLKSAELTFPGLLSSVHRQAASYAVGVGLHQCAVEFARKTLPSSNGEFNGN